jgi:hypothetical protein
MQCGYAVAIAVHLSNVEAIDVAMPGSQAAEFEVGALEKRQV